MSGSEIIKREAEIQRLKKELYEAQEALADLGLRIGYILEEHGFSGYA